MTGGVSMRKKRSFREKLADAKDLPRVQPLTGDGRSCAHRRWRHR